MRNSLGRKTVIATAAAVVALAVFAGTALAAPVLQPGVTSAPGMSGRCTKCHTYATKSSTTKSSTAKYRTASVSHPYTGKASYKTGSTFTVFGFVTPKLPSSTNAKITLRFEKLNKSGKWSVVTTLTPTATVTSTGAFKKKTNYKASVTVDGVGQYRVRAKLAWRDSKGTSHTKTSTYHRFAISK